jgi:hypothetical protein
MKRIDYVAACSKNCHHDAFVNQISRRISHETEIFDELKNQISKYRNIKTLKYQTSKTSKYQRKNENQNIRKWKMESQTMKRSKKSGNGESVQERDVSKYIE